MPHDDYLMRSDVGSVFMAKWLEVTTLEPTWPRQEEASLTSVNCMS